MDAGELHFQTWYAAGRELGIAVSREIFDESFGQTGLQSAKKMARGTGADIGAFVARKEELCREMAAGYIVLLPGVRKWLDIFDRMGMRQAIASSGSPENIQTVVCVLRIRSYFSALVSGEGRQSKPDPATYLAAAAKLMTPPSACLVIEDTPAGIEAAHRAGMKCIAAATTNDMLRLQAADVIVATMEELEQDQIEELL